MANPRILLYDLETAPIILYNWALFQETTHPKFIRRNWFVLCWSAKWLGEKKIYNSALPKYRGYKPLPSKTEKNIDKEVMKDLWVLLDECDVAIAHNLKSFDRKKSNTRFIINGMKPPSPYAMVDTLTVARSEFKFTSNKLEYLAEKLDVQRKMDAGGFELWLGCEDGCKKSWKKMQKYCDQDVRALEEVYLKELPYMPKHPNLNIILGGDLCPRCGHNDFIKDGIRYNNTGKFQKLRCKGCGGISKRKFKHTNKKGLVKTYRPTNP